ncbi:CNH domain-containing protein [Mycena leptocephala]|nr:CNH domain-containing protein [Mycena leptocephala]
MPSSFSSSNTKGGDAKSVYDSLYRLYYQNAEKPTDPSHLPEAATDQFSTEIYELIIDHLHTDKASLVACSRVCRSWFPRSKCLLLELTFCHPLSLASHFCSTTITCAIPDDQGAIFYGTTDVYKVSQDGSGRQLLSMRDVSQIAILANSNLFLFLARGSFFTMPLSALYSGSSMPDPDITLVSKHVLYFAVYRCTCAHERHRVCVVKRSAFSDTPSLQVYDVAADNHLLGLGFRLRVSTLNSMPLSIALETHSVQFLCPTWLAAATKKAGFRVVDLMAPGIYNFPHSTDPLSTEFSLKKAKPMTLFQIPLPSSEFVFLLCYNKFAIYMDRRQKVIRKELIMRWTRSSNAFALHEPYILAFCSTQVEVWNIETAEMVQKIHGRYRLLNTPQSGEKILVQPLSRSLGEVAEMVFHQHASVVNSKSR